MADQPSDPPAPPAPEADDLTAILVDTEHGDEAAIRATVAAGGYGHGWLRVRPLAGLGLTQIELLDGRGLPQIDPALVIALSQEGRRAVFLHVNHTASQAIVHWFRGGEQVEGWVGTPGDLAPRLERALGRQLPALLAGDDGTRHGFGQAASSTVALARGRILSAPPGTITGLGSFAFHDRGAPGVERVALLAFDEAALRTAWAQTPGAELAARVKALPEAAVGPLQPVRDEATSALAALGDRAPAAAGLRSVVALELVALSEACLYGAGEAVSFVDGRLLPLFSLTSHVPAIEDADEAEELEARASVLAAMEEVLPYTSPEGALLEQVADEELAGLAHWTRPGEEYVGSLFLLRADRLRRALVEIEPRDLAARADLFYRAWWKAGHDEPTGDAFAAWRRALDERGAPDVERFLTAWAEWRTVLELAAVNRLQTALLFYELGQGA
jgi:hypothetical protein